LESAYQREIEKLIEREIGNRVAGLKAEIGQGRGTPKVHNKLGVLFARYGLLDEAEKHFRAALESAEYLSALMNVGNLMFLRENFEQALSFFERAAAQDQNNPKIILSLSRTNHELENYGTARRLFARLKEVDSNLASRFSYLELRGEEAVRAADLGRVRNTVLWEEEE
jgi:tetratricopeptide (TPR) repeat protein